MQFDVGWIFCFFLVFIRNDTYLLQFVLVNQLAGNFILDTSVDLFDICILVYVCFDAYVFIFNSSDVILFLIAFDRDFHLLGRFDMVWLSERLGCSII